MSRVPDDPQSWPSEPELEAVLFELRRQLDAVKARLEEHRRQMRAAGLVVDPDGPNPAA